MTRAQARESAREILEIIPLVMRTVAAELRAAGEMPAPAHFGLLSMLSVRPRKLTELASAQGVSLPTMSNSISAMAERGWVRRTAPEGDRRVGDDRGDRRRAAPRSSASAAARRGTWPKCSRRSTRRRGGGCRAGWACCGRCLRGSPASVSRKSHRTPAKRRSYLS